VAHQRTCWLSVVSYASEATTGIEMNLHAGEEWKTLDRGCFAGRITLPPLELPDLKRFGVAGFSRGFGVRGLCLACDMLCLEPATLLSASMCWLKLVSSTSAYLTASTSRLEAAWLSDPRPNLAGDANLLGRMRIRFRRSSSSKTSSSSKFVSIEAPNLLSIVGTASWLLSCRCSALSEEAGESAGWESPGSSPPS